MNSLNVARQKIQEYEASADSLCPEAEARVQNSHAANRLEGIADEGVSIYRRLQSADPQTFEDAKDLYEAYVAWAEHSTLVLRAIDTLEASPQGAKVFSGQDLRRVFSDVSSHIDTFKDRIASLEVFISGNGLSAEKFLNAL
jgi:hypothetical protein